MPCPTCNRTLQNLGLATTGRRTFWCQTCGTIKTESTDGSFEEHQRPALVVRAGALVELIRKDPALYLNDFPTFAAVKELVDRPKVQ